MASYSKSRYVGLLSCNSIRNSRLVCYTYCNTKYECKSHSQSFWGAYPHFYRCGTRKGSGGTSCVDQTALPNIGGCGADWWVAECKAPQVFYGGSVRSCGPSNGLKRTHPSYRNGTKLQACSPTGSEYQVCSINTPWATSVFLGTKTSRFDVAYPYFWGRVNAT